MTRLLYACLEFQSYPQGSSNFVFCSSLPFFLSLSLSPSLSLSLFLFLYLSLSFSSSCFFVTFAPKLFFLFFFIPYINELFLSVSPLMDNNFVSSPTNLPILAVSLPALSLSGCILLSPGSGGKQRGIHVARARVSRSLGRERSETGRQVAERVPVCACVVCVGTAGIGLSMMMVGRGRGRGGSGGGGSVRIETRMRRCDLSLSLSCLLYTSPSPRDCIVSRMPSSA